MSDRKLPPDPEDMNDRRAGWAREAIEHFGSLTGADTESHEAFGDLLANMFHFCDREDLDMERMIVSARGCYYEEIDQDYRARVRDAPEVNGEGARTALMKEWASVKKELEDSEEHRDEEGGFEDAEWASINDAAQHRAGTVYRIATAAGVELPAVPKWLKEA